MITLKTEFQKIKRRKIGLTMFALISVQFAWFLWSTKSPDEKELARGWMDLLYTCLLYTSDAADD